MDFIFGVIVGCLLLCWRGRVAVGMTTGQVLTEWGEPRRKTVSANAYGSNEKWYYGSERKMKCLNFDNDILTLIEEWVRGQGWRQLERLPYTVTELALHLPLDIGSVNITSDG
jgi:hypothetical protein